MTLSNQAKRPRTSGQRTLRNSRADPDTQGDKVNSRMMGANLEQRKPRVLVYFGGAHIYYDKLRESADGGFPELSFSKSAA